MWRRKQSYFNRLEGKTAMRTLIFAYLLVLTTIAWSSPAWAPWCGYWASSCASNRQATVPEECQVKCADAVGPREVFACISEKCRSEEPQGSAREPLNPVPKGIGPNPE